MTLVGYLMAFVMGVAMKALLHLQVRMGEAFGFERPSLAWIVVVLVVTLPFVTLIHEAGHFLAGALFAQCCRRFVVGPFELARGGAGWTFKLVRIRHAGLVDLVPSTFDGFGLQRAACALGGPMASLLAALAFTVLSLRASTPAVFWIWSLSTQWAVVGLMSLLPVRLTTARSDGYLLWEAIRGGPVLDGTQRDLLIPSSHATPLRLRDWPHELVGRLAGNPVDPLARRYCAYLAYVHFLDRRDSLTAAQYLVRLTAEWTLTDPPEYALEAAYFHACHGNDPETARKWLALELRNVEPWVRLRAQAAIEQAAGNRESARVLIDQALAGLRKAPACGARQYELDRVQDLMEDSRSRSRAGVA